MKSKETTKSINIGIDFGTCYSKVCFEDETKVKNYVKLCKNESIPEYKHSKIYYDYVKNIFYYQKPEITSSIETIKYFKYLMIDKSLPQSKHITTSNPKSKPEELCSVFFIACLINQSKKFIEDHYKKLGVFIFEWNITMGVPIDNYSNEFKSLYDMILQIAIKISKNISKYSIQLNKIDNFYQENKYITIPKYKDSPNNTLSELYAESIAFLEDKNVSEGLYAIIDIGGATVDMAVISKTPDEFNRNKFRYGIIAKSIEPLGIEILIQKISKNDNMHGDVKKLLKENSFENTDIEYCKTEELKLSRKMKEAFAKLVIDSKNKFRNTLVNQNGKMKVILCGGGVQYKWYKSCISSIRAQLKNILADIPTGFRLEFVSVRKFQRHYNNINHRLIISSGLAQDIQRIPDLDGFPWDYPDIHPKIKDDDSENIMIERYDKIL
jgi:hypothetical protein